MNMRLFVRIVVFSKVWLCAMFWTCAFAVPAGPQPLWPDGPPDNNGLEGPETTGGCIGNISIPTYTVWPAPKAHATGAAVVVMAGGGYGVVCVEAEGMPIVPVLHKLGITAIVLKYRLPNGHHEIPANDARRAIRTARANAKAWGIDSERVGVWGFSAGGHLAATVATRFDCGDSSNEDSVERVSSRPDFCILFYPVVSMNKEIGHAGSRARLMGGDDLVDRYSNELHVTADTPPCFLLHCTDDRTVMVENSIRLYRALVAHQVAAELLVFEKGGHGPNAFRTNPSWEPAIADWLKKRGCLD